MTLLLGKLLVILLEVLKLRCADAKRRWAESLAVFQGGTLALGDVHECRVAHIDAVDLQAAAVLPRVANIQVAEPAGAVEGALLILRVQVVQVVPAEHLIFFCLVALVRQVVKVGRERGLQHVTVNVHDLAVQQAHEVLPADIK